MPTLELRVSNEFQRLLSDTASSKSNPSTTDKDVLKRAVALYAFLHKQVRNTPACYGLRGVRL